MRSARYSKRDSLKVDRTPHLFAIMVDSWARSLYVVSRVSAASVDILLFGHMLNAWLEIDGMEK